MAKLSIEIDSQETGDGYKNAIKDAETYEQTLRSLIAGEAAVAANNQAIDHFEQMTVAEKEAYMAATSLQEGNQGTSFSFTELSSQINIATQAFNTVKGVVEDLYGTYAKNAEAVRDLTLISGQSAEETSRFIQVLDDYQISAEDAEAATRKLKDNGLVPSIDTLAKLADQYKKIQDPAERMQFIQDNLGRGGAKWINVLNQESSALRENAASVAQNLIFTDKQIQQYEQERLALDSLSDAWEGLKNQAGAALGQLILNTTQSQEAIKLLQEQGVATNAQTIYTQQYRDALKQVQDAELQKSQATTEATEAYQKESDQIKEAQKAQEALTQSNKDYLSSIGDLSTSIDDYRQKQGDLRQQYHELIAKQQELIAQGYGPQSQAIQDINNKLAENQQKQQENAAAFDKASKERILAMLQEQLAIGGLDEKETAFLLEKGEQWGIYSKDAVQAMKEAQEEVKNLTASINGIPTAKSITIYMSTHVKDDTYIPPSGGGGSTGKPHAGGGSFMIPYSAGNEGWNLGGGNTASGGERVTVTPQGQTQNTGGGNNMTFNLNIMLDSSTPDPEKVAYNIAPAVTRVLRDLGVTINA